MPRFKSEVSPKRRNVIQEMGALALRISDFAKFSRNTLDVNFYELLYIMEVLFHALKVKRRESVELLPRFFVEI